MTIYHMVNNFIQTKTTQRVPVLWQVLSFT